MKHEAIKFNTKKQLSLSLKRLLEKKSFSKITISELASECGLNRKTFYYHFEDIYGLLEWHLEQEINSIINPSITFSAPNAETATLILTSPLLAAARSSVVSHSTET